MPDFYHRYLRGAYEDVYDELLALGTQVFAERIYQDALLVAHEMMRRVRANIEVLVARLSTLGYHFGEGFWDDHISPEEKARIEADISIYRPPAPDTREQIARLEKLTGTLPLCLRSWYENVGSVNLIGLFPAASHHGMDSQYGSVLDPLFVYSLEMVLKMVTTYIENNVWDRDPTLPLSPDNYHKYNCSGSGSYAIRLPCRACDAPLLLERHHTTFVKYLRLVFFWGGFPGLEKDCRLSAHELEYLRQGLLPF